MARSKSEDKRNAILDAATAYCGARSYRYPNVGDKQAGIAGGTLFTYFSTKDDLVNALLTGRSS